jgi:hypothetical protein
MERAYQRGQAMAQTPPTRWLGRRATAGASGDQDTTIDESALPPLPPGTDALLGDDAPWSDDADAETGGEGHDDDDGDDGDNDDDETAALLQHVMALGLGHVHAGATDDIEWRVT